MTVISLTYGDYTEAALEDVVQRENRLIDSVDLSGNNFTPEQFELIVNKYIVKLRALTTLDIKDNKIGCKGATHLFNNLRNYCKHIKYLDVNENAIHDESLYSLATLLRDSKLETLNLVTNHITRRGLPTLCDGVRQSVTLKQLSLAFNLLDDEGAVYIANTLSHHPSLIHLDLSDNHIGDVGAIALAKAFIISSSSRLECLNLSVNHIGNIGFTAIGDALTRTHNKHFCFIDLGCNSTVNDEGRRSFISFVSRMKYVNYIDLTSCDLSDRDACELINAVNCPSSSVCKVEWYNNPRIKLETEKTLCDVFEAKQRNRVRALENIFLTIPVIALSISLSYLAASFLIKRKLQL